MAAKYTKDLTAFHVSIEGFPKLDERRFAEQLIRSLDLPFVPYALTGTEFRNVLPYVTYLEDFPLTHPNSAAYYPDCKGGPSTRSHRCTSGEGADELFGGYSWNYRRRRRLLQLEALLNKPGTVVFHPRPARLCPRWNAGIGASISRISAADGRYD